MKKTQRSFNSTIPKSQKRIKSRPRTKSEKLRIYGPPGYVEWIHEQPCIACGVVGYSEVAHIKTGGTGRKSDWTDTAPLCGTRISHPLWIPLPGCHQKLHGMGRQSFELQYDVDLTVAAIAIQERFASHTGSEEQ